MANSLSGKLKIKPGQSVLLLNAPAETASWLEPLPAGATLRTAPGKGKIDAVLMFVKNRDELRKHAPTALAAIEGDTLFWAAYPKGTSKIKTDINRDRGWDELTAAGYMGVAQVSITDTWSAIRMRHTSFVKT